MTTTITDPDGRLVNNVTSVVFAMDAGSPPYVTLEYINLPVDLVIPETSVTLACTCGHMCPLSRPVADQEGKKP